MQKAASFFAKIYDKTGVTFRRVIDSSKLLNTPQIIREVNKSAGEVNLDIAFPWDNFGFGTTLFDGDLIKIYAVNASNPTGTLVYQGNVMGIKTNYTNNSSSVSLRLYPIDAILGRITAYVGTDAVKTFTSLDIDDIFSNVLTDMQTTAGYSYFTEDFDAPSLSITYSIRLLNSQNALDKAYSYLSSSWYWAINASGVIRLKQWDDVNPTHLFTIGKDVDSMGTNRTIADIINGEMLSWNNPVYSFSHYSDATSQTNNGKFQRIVEDREIPAAYAADARGNSDISKLKDPKISVTLTVNANYPIETINPGDTCKIQNITDNTSQLVQGVFRILRTEYDGAICTLTLSEIIDNFGSTFIKSITPN